MSLGQSSGQSLEKSYESLTWKEIRVGQIPTTFFNGARLVGVLGDAALVFRAGPREVEFV
jgi:hypothetical protein